MFHTYVLVHGGLNHRVPASAESGREKKGKQNWCAYFFSTINNFCVIWNQKSDKYLTGCRAILESWKPLKKPWIFFSSLKSLKPLKNHGILISKSNKEKNIKSKSRLYEKKFFFFCDQHNITGYVKKLFSILLVWSSYQFSLCFSSLFREPHRFFFHFEASV